MKNPWIRLFQGLGALVAVVLALSCSSHRGASGRPLSEETIDTYVARLDPLVPEDRRIIDLHEHVKANPDDVESTLALGREWHDRGYLLAALATFSELSREHPDMPEVWNDMGRVYISLQDYPKAKSALVRAIDLNPDFAAAHYNLAVAMASNNEVKGVLDEYVKALRLDPSLADPEKNWHASRNPWIGLFKHFQYMLERGQHLPTTPLPGAHAEEEPSPSAPAAGPPQG